MKAEKARLDADGTAKPKSYMIGSSWIHQTAMVHGTGVWGTPYAYINEEQTISLAPEEAKKE